MELSPSVGADNSELRPRRAARFAFAVTRAICFNIALMFSAAKDAITSAAAKAWVNKFIERYGRVEELKIDSKRNRIEMVCKLNGEVSPIGVTIEKYAIDKEGDRKFIQVLDSSATRPWLQAVLRDHVHGRKVALPPWAATAL